MWKRDEAVKPPTPPSPAPPPPVVPAASAPTVASHTETRAAGARDVVHIGKSVVIKGELNGSEDLTIEGHVEGKIELRDHVLTIGPNGKIRAAVFAKAVIVSAKSSATSPHREGRHSRQRLGGRRHHLAARGDCRGRALPRQRRHEARRRAAGVQAAGEPPKAEVKPAPATTGTAPVANPGPQKVGV